mmetsp:Transcript_11991/g.28073  ORF Transcript_11991/g.28073 Transcript_11991/m.28073 type:complete len:215 (+) Transcript_11991:157-801(+)
MIPYLQWHQKCSGHHTFDSFGGIGLVIRLIYAVLGVGIGNASHKVFPSGIPCPDETNKVPPGLRQQCVRFRVCSAVHLQGPARALPCDGAGKRHQFFHIRITMVVVHTFEITPVQQRTEHGLGAITEPVQVWTVVCSYSDPCKDLGQILARAIHIIAEDGFAFDDAPSVVGCMPIGKGHLLARTLLPHLVARADFAIRRVDTLNIGWRGCRHRQ